MQEPSVVHSTFVLERSYPKPPKTVFSAFAEEGKKRRWYAEGEANEVQQFAMDFRVGGTERLIYKLKPGTPVAGMIITNESRYLDIVSGALIVTATTMDLGEKRILVSLVTAEFLETDNGTDLILTHQGVYLSGPNGLTPPMIETGWNGLLDSLQAELAR
ncbi:SRPBCC domain-containing protein [Granulicella sp. L46]|uniref:SRPBCC domain-containing protein n=1 Tax=Granulicella sp. L46 TaxID=1641865 RepID=UPI00131BE30D|nr:SRPBCC domain-containing protein [Granulicella sp. L46]